MHTRILMSASGLYMAVLGLAASFMPKEILGFAGATVEAQPVLIIQVTGALYLGFACLNWAARGVLIGGIYARPVALGNFFHFTVASIALAKTAFPVQSPLIFVATAAYVVFAGWFGLVIFTHPGARRDDGEERDDS